MHDREWFIEGLKFTLEESGWDANAAYDQELMIQVVTEAIALLKAQEPRVMTLEEVKEKIGSGECVFTECEKEGQWMRYGDARLSVDQGDSCRIAFLISRCGDDPYVRWWMIYYENYNKTWRCWSHKPTDAQREATPWE